MCAALSFTANFSFAYVAAVSILMFLLRASWQIAMRTRHSLEQTSLGRSYVRLSAACVIPGVVVTFFVCGSVLVNWPKGQLYFGSTSLAEMWNSMVSSSFYELNPYIINPLAHSLLTQVRPFLPPLLIVLCLLQAVLIFRTKLILAATYYRAFAFCVYVTGIISLSLSLHWLAFRIFRIPLPKERTAIFFVPLLILAAGAVIVTSSSIQRHRVLSSLSALSIGTLFIGAIYFIGCIRLMYFKEWRFDADVKTAFLRLEKLNSECAIAEIPSDWRYVSSLNFYRLYFNSGSIAPFGTATSYPSDKKAYVLYAPSDQESIDRLGLKIIYRGELSDLVVAIRPDVACKPGTVNEIRDSTARQ
jgi:hypothetical protein